MAKKTKKVKHQLTDDERLAFCQKVFRGMAKGKSARSQCKKNGNPSINRFYRWIERLDLLSEYARARYRLADHYADVIATIGETAAKEAKKLGREAGPLMHARKMHADNLKWIAARMNAKKWGDRVKISGDEDAPITIKTAEDSVESKLLKMGLKNAEEANGDDDE